MKEIPLTKGKITLVDDEDFKWLSKWKWSLNNKGYARRNTYIGMVDGKEKHHWIFMHREILNHYGRDLQGKIIDHGNRNCLDNQKVNLRIGTSSNNNQNHNLFKTNTSGHSGLSWDSTRNRWETYIWLFNKKIHLGRFKEKTDAILARKFAENFYHNFKISDEMKQLSLNRRLLF